MLSNWSRYAETPKPVFGIKILTSSFIIIIFFFKAFILTFISQDGYYYLLRRYLESVCEHGCEARRVYLHLIACLKDLQKLNESHIQLFLEVNPKLVEPLLIEIFDLNPMK